LVNQEIVASNVKKDIQRVANVRAMLADLRSAWSEAILKAGVSNETAGTAVRGVNIAG
jgi:flagellin-specific chaperone FliS